jgi:hypothetical protein
MHEPLAQAGKSTKHKDYFWVDGFYDAMKKQAICVPPPKR